MNTPNFQINNLPNMEGENNMDKVKNVVTSTESEKQVSEAIAQLLSVIEPWVIDFTCIDDFTVELELKEMEDLDMAEMVEYSLLDYSVDFSHDYDGKVTATIAFKNIYLQQIYEFLRPTVISYELYGAYGMILELEDNDFTINGEKWEEALADEIDAQYTVIVDKMGFVHIKMIIENYYDYYCDLFDYDLDEGFSSGGLRTIEDIRVMTVIAIFQHIIVSLEIPALDELNIEFIDIKMAKRMHWEKMLRNEFPNEHIEIRYIGDDWVNIRFE